MSTEQKSYAFGLTTSQVEVGPFKGLAVRHIGPYHEIGGAFGNMFALVGQHQVPMSGCLGAYYDHPGSTPPEELRSDAVALVPEEYDGCPEGLNKVELPGGKFLVVRYVGAYDQLGEVWGTVMNEVIPGEGVTEADQASYELYIEHNEEDPSKCITDLYIPLT